MSTELLAKVKASLRISHDKLDGDVQDSIDACLADLAVCGILPEKLDASKELDPLILNAVKLFCKREYTDDPVKAARYRDGYHSLKGCLQVAEGYGYKEESANE